MHIKRLLRFFAGLCLLAAAFSSLAAAQSERILDFHSDIALREDSSLFVTETIRVISNGAQIRHGIYRDFRLATRTGWETVLWSASRFLAPRATALPSRLASKTTAMASGFISGTAGRLCPLEGTRTRFPI